MRQFQTLSLLAFIFFVSSASANVLLEPIVGGQFSGQVASPFKGSTADTGNFSSVVYGARLGLDLSGFLIGAEYLGDNNVSVKFDGPNGWGTSSTNAIMSNTSYGGFLGIELMNPLTLRLIGTFFAVSRAHVTHTDATGTIDSDTDLSGYGYKGEISTRVAHFITLGVAYYQMIYTDAKDNLTNTSSVPVPVGTQHAVMTQISIPFEL